MKQQFRLAFALIFGILMISGKLFSQSVESIDVELENCLNDSVNFTTIGMFDCVDQAYKAWDKRLNKSYSHLMSEIPKQDAERLRLAQRKWLELFELDIAFMREFSEHQQGSLYGLTHTMLALELVKSRTIVLEKMEDEFIE